MTRKSQLAHISASMCLCRKHNRMGKATMIIILRGIEGQETLLLQSDSQLKSFNIPSTCLNPKMLYIKSNFFHNKNCQEKTINSSERKGCNNKWQRRLGHVFQKHNEALFQLRIGKPRELHGSIFKMT